MQPGASSRRISSCPEYGQVRNCHRCVPTSAHNNEQPKQESTPDASPCLKLTRHPQYQMNLVQAACHAYDVVPLNPACMWIDVVHTC
jgi:hypothetical protein